MIDLLRYKEVFLTMDVSLWTKVVKDFKNEKIDFKTKIVNCGTKNRQSGVIWGELGENQDFVTIYYIYVSRKCFLKAKNMIEKVERDANI